MELVEIYKSWHAHTNAVRIGVYGDCDLIVYGDGDDDDDDDAADDDDDDEYADDDDEMMMMMI